MTSQPCRDWAWPAGETPCVTFQGRALGPAEHTLGPGLSPQEPWWRAGVAGVPIKGAAVTPAGPAPDHQHRRGEPRDTDISSQNPGGSAGSGPKLAPAQEPPFRSLLCPPGHHCLLQPTPSSPPQVSAAHVGTSNPGVPEHFLTASLVTEREPSSHLHEGPWSQSRTTPAAPPAPDLDPGMGDMLCSEQGRVTLGEPASSGCRGPALPRPSERRLYVLVWGYVLVLHFCLESEQGSSKCFS